MKGKVIFYALFGFIALLVGAYSFDSVRVVSAAYEELKEQDELMRGFEEKYINTVNSLQVSSSIYSNAYDEYRRAASISDRRVKFDSLVIIASQAAAQQIDVSNPLTRRLGDEMAGVLNRRAIAEKRYLELQGVYASLYKGSRASIARMFVAVPAP